MADWRGVEQAIGQREHGDRAPEIDEVDKARRADDRAPEIDEASAPDIEHGGAVLEADERRPVEDRPPATLSHAPGPDRGGSPISGAGPPVPYLPGAAHSIMSPSAHDRDSGHLVSPFIRASHE